MNDGSAQRSPLSAYRIARADDDSDQSEKVSIHETSMKPFDAAPTKMPEMAKESITNEGDIISPFSSHGAVVGNPGLAKALLGKEGLAEDFDMSMVPMSFPQRLHEMVTSEENSAAVSWLPHGKGFVINDKKEFSETVLPKYFKESKFTSFTRKLNRWGFTRVARGSESGAYYHPHFHRDNLRRTLLMTCNQRTDSKRVAKPAAAALSAGRHFYAGGPLDHAIQAAATRQILQLHEGNSSGQLEDQTVNQLKAELLLRQEQQQLAKIEELRTAQNQQLNNSESALQKVLAQMGGSALQNTQPSLTPQQQLLAQLGASSSLRNQPLGSASTSLNYPSTSAPTAALGSAIAASMGSPMGQGPPARASLAASSESNLGSNQQSSLLNAARNLQSTDANAYMALLLAQQKAQNQADSLGQLLNQEGGRAQQQQQNLLQRTQQQKLSELLQMSAQQQGAQSQQGKSQMLPPKKR